MIIGDHLRSRINKKSPPRDLESRAGGSLATSQKTASTMSNPNSTSRDSRAAETVNGRRYQHSNAQVYLNPQGLPVAFRRVRVLKPGTFAGASRLHLITPRKVSSVSRTCFDAYKARCHPLN
jgi:hypothetical protein